MTTQPPVDPESPTQTYYQQLVDEFMTAFDQLMAIIVVRAQALRDHAYVLSFLGRYAEALKYVGQSERAFAQIPARTSTWPA